MKTYQALVIEKNAEGTVTHHLKELPLQDVPEKHVEIRVHYSSLNYKDALSFQGHPGVTQKFPHVPGIDAAGTVTRSHLSSFTKGDEVIVTGYDLGMNTHGGLGEMIIVPEEWIVPKPAGLSFHEAMILGTAGFTAALCVQEIIALVKADVKNPIAITGATGGVGSLSLAILHLLGYNVHAISRKASREGSEEAGFLFKLCALKKENIHNPQTLLEDTKAPIGRAVWASAIDTVGGDVLAYLLKTIRYRGAVAACGIAAGDRFTSSVFPFILRSIRLIGIDSVACPHTERLAIWEKLASDWKPTSLLVVAKTISLPDAPAALEKFTTGKITGRIVVEYIR